MAQQDSKGPTRLQGELHARVGGSGFTWFNYRGKVVAFSQTIAITSPQPVAEPVAIQPLNFRRPAEIVVPRAVGAGTLTITGYELWNQPMWARLTGLGEAADLADVFQLMWNSGVDDLQASVVVDPPVGHGSGGKKYVRTFHGIKISHIDDGETIDINTMTIPKTITMMYAWSVRTGVGRLFPNQIGTTGI